MAFINMSDLHTNHTNLPYKEETELYHKHK